MDTWCHRQQQHYDKVTAPLLQSLPASAHDFLEVLNVIVIHPHCLNATIRHSYEMPGVPAMGPLKSHDGHLDTAWDFVVTLLMRTLPSLAAMTELWLRLLAFLVAPLGAAHLLQTYNTARSSSSSTAMSDGSPSSGRWLPMIIGLTLASCLVLATDTLYVLEYGPIYGWSLLGVALGASYLISKQHSLHSSERRNIRLVLLTVVALLLVLTVDFSGEHNRFTVKWGGDNDDEACHISEGLYYDRSNPAAQRLVNNWSPTYYTYDDAFPRGVATPWMPTGDARTGLPFLLHFVATPPSFVRLWLPVPDSNHHDNASSTVPLSDGEVMALDASFPTAAGYNRSRPVYLVLHGLSGGSQEEYIKDFVLRRNAEGSTVLVMIARGLMDLPIRGWNLFHGARTTDVHVAATAIRSALDELHGQQHQHSQETSDPPPTLVGVGYSMGGIIMANYVSRAGPDCPLNVAVSVSGGLDMRYEANFTRAQRLWQPILTQELRNTFVVGKWGERVRQRLTPSEMKHMLRAYHITDIDRTAIVAYNKFRNLDHYYSDMSALGDTSVDHHLAYNHSSDDDASLTTTHLPSQLKRLQTLSIPLLVVHALDDPLISWRTVAANHGLMHPQQLTQWVPNGNLFVLLTKRGGHVGWPMGVNPTKHNWKWMNDVVMSFVQAHQDSTDATKSAVMDERNEDAESE
jgi:predicted alpha/beta-fold hydrolase